MGWGLVGLAAVLLVIGGLALAAQKRLLIGSIGGGVLRAIAAIAGAMVLMGGVGMQAASGDGVRALGLVDTRHRPPELRRRAGGAPGHTPGVAFQDGGSIPRTRTHHRDSPAAARRGGARGERER